MRAFLEKINSRESEIMAEAERSFVRTLDGGCSSPVAACASVEKDTLVLRGLYYDEAEKRAVTGTMQVLRRMDMVIVRKLSRKGRVIEQILRSTVRRKPQL